MNGKTRVMQMIFAGAASVAALVLFSAVRPFDTGATGTAVASPATAPFATDDTNFVNDQGQTCGDIFTQNAFSQSP